MRRRFAFLLILVAPAAAADAQTAAPAAPPSRGYVEGVAQSAFGNVTSQSYGAEFGATVATNLQLFVEGGRIRNVATPEISAGAQKIAAALAQLQTAAVTYSVKEPVSFGVAGVRYLIPVPSPRVQPYVLGGVGVARVKNDVAFRLSGSDASSTLSQYVTLGSDLSGSATRPMMTLGGGVVWPAWQKLVLDFQYRYGRIFTEDVGINTNRAGIGIGVRF